MARPKKVLIENKKLRLGPSAVLPQSVGAWERNGWTRVDDGDDVDEQLVDDETDPDEPGNDKE